MIYKDDDKIFGEFSAKITITHLGSFHGDGWMEFITIIENWWTERMINRIIKCG